MWTVRGQLLPSSLVMVAIVAHSSSVVLGSRVRAIGNLLAVLLDLLSLLDGRSALTVLLLR